MDFNVEFAFRGCTVSGRSMKMQKSIIRSDRSAAQLGGDIKGRMFNMSRQLGCRLMICAVNVNLSVKEP